MVEIVSISILVLENRFEKWLTPSQPGSLSGEGAGLDIQWTHLLVSSNPTPGIVLSFDLLISFYESTLKLQLKHPPSICLICKYFNSNTKITGLKSATGSDQPGWLSGLIHVGISIPVLENRFEKKTFRSQPGWPSG